MTATLLRPAPHPRPIEERVAEATWDGLWLLHVTAEAIIRNLDARCVREGSGLTGREDRLWSEQEHVRATVAAEMRRRLQAVMGDVPLDDVVRAI